MLLGALPVIRRQGFFEMFYWTHLNYITFSVLYCLHSPAGLIWFLVPGAVFVLYKLSVFVRLCLGLRSSVALECTALQSRVTKLVMERRFSFHAGDYVFINIPQISRYMPQSQKSRFINILSDLSGIPSRSPALQNWKTSSASTSELLEVGQMPSTVLFPMKTKNGGRYSRQLLTSRAKLRSVPSQPGAPQSVVSPRPVPWWSTLTAPTARPPPPSSPRNTRSSWPQG